MFAKANIVKFLKHETNCSEVAGQGRQNGVLIQHSVFLFKVLCA